VKREKEERVDLKGTSLKVYLALLKNGNKGGGPRTVQRELDLSSPSLANYHIEKLVSMGLIERDTSGNYRVKRDIQIETLANFISLFGRIFPKYLVCAVFFTTMLATFVTVQPFRAIAAPEYIAALVFGVSTCTVMWYETLSIWRRRPF